MGREKEGFRDNMALLNARFPDCDMLSTKQVAEFIGCSIRTVYRNISINKITHKISKADLARLICS